MYKEKITCSRFKIALAVAAGVFFVGILYWHHMLVNSINIEYTCNTGIGLGIMIPQVMYEIIWMVVIGYLLSYIVRWKKYLEKDRYLALAVVSMLVGAISNRMDRVIYQCVVDYIPFYGIFYFNIADVLIFVGAAIIVYRGIKINKKEEE